MVDFNFENDCYGCGACANSCPVDAIKMKPDKNGFLVPEINNEKCISCGKCDKTCIALSESCKDETLKDKEAFLFTNPNLDTLKDSASGGAFGILAEKILAKGGYVCGCVFDDDMNAVHIVSNKKSDMFRMQGSKYVQSDITKCVEQIKALLHKGIFVLFSGTPCQCAAVQAIFRGRKENDYLYTVAIICHGVPSPKVWNGWKKHLEEKMNSSMIYANHRAKGKNYNTPESVYLFKNGKKLRQATYLEDLYCYAFSTDIFLRNTCYSCGYKGANITSDIIIGDYFDFNNNSIYRDGVSSVIINTERGRELFDCSGNTSTRIEIASIIEKNKALVKPVPLNVNRQKFFDDLMRDNIETAIKSNIPYMKFMVKKYLHKIKLFEQLRKIKR